MLDAALTWTHGALQHARTADLDAPTPCRGWVLRDLLVHMEDSLAALGEAASGRVEVDVAPVADGPAPVLVDQVCRRARVVRAGWEARVTSAPVAVGDLPLGRDTLTLVGALEVVVHGWDVARATGAPLVVPADLAARLLPVAQAAVGDRGSRFGPVVPVAPGAPAADHLLAHLGRDPAWSAGLPAA
ncbi:TIGR03086 family metal-binding protein [Nocardioides marmoraquaticus]